MKQMVVCHMAKLKGNCGGMGNHVDRVKGMEHSYKDADPLRLHLNRELVQDKFKNISLPEAINLRIKEGYNCRTKAGELKKIYADAIKCVELNLSGSHERMKEIENNPELLDAWYSENFEFAKQRYGEENIVRFTLHLDETTPHIHCLFVPLTEDGRLCANDLMKKKDLYNLQDDYAEKMNVYGLERGERGSDKVHDNKQVYTGKVLRAENEIEKLIVKGVFGVDTTKTTENLKTSLKSNILALKKAEDELLLYKTKNGNHISKIKSNTTEEIIDLKKEVVKEKNRADGLQRFINQGLQNPEVFEIEKERRRKLVEDRENEKQNEIKRIAIAVKFHLENNYAGRINNISLDQKPLNKALDKEFGFTLSIDAIKIVHQEVKNQSQNRRGLNI